MDLRVSVSRERDATVVHVDGRLAAQGVRDLESTVDGAAGPVVLDLSNPPANVRKVTPADVQRVARKYLGVLRTVIVQPQ